MTIYCYDADCQLIGIIEDFVNMRFNRSWTGVGDWEFLIDGTSTTEVGVITSATYIKMGDGQCGIITQITERKDENEYDYTISGLELKGIAKKRVIQPLEGTDMYKIEDKSPEFIIASLLSDQLTDPENENRQIAGSIAPYTEETGETTTYENRYVNLADAISEFAAKYEIGWYANIEHGSIVWHIAHGVDRTAHQHVNEPLLMGFEFDMLQSLNYSISTQPETNVAIVGGKGEGTERSIVIVNDDENVGLERQEIYVDARNAEDDELEDEGLETLASYGGATTVHVKPIFEARKYYRDIYNIGDYATLLEYDADLQLTEVCSIWENNEYKLDFTFGYEGKTFGQAMRRFTKNFLSVMKADPRQ